MSSVCRLFCGTVARGGDKHSLRLIHSYKGQRSLLMFNLEDVKFFKVCPFHEFKLQFQFRISFFAFTFVFSNQDFLIIISISLFFPTGPEVNPSDASCWSWGPPDNHRFWKGPVECSLPAPSRCEDQGVCLPLDTGSLEEGRWNRWITVFWLQLNLNGGLKP